MLRSWTCEDTANVKLHEGTNAGSMYGCQVPAQNIRSSTKDSTKNCCQIIGVLDCLRVWKNVSHYPAIFFCNGTGRTWRWAGYSCRAVLLCDWYNQTLWGLWPLIFAQR